MGMTVFMSTHILSEVDKLADRIGFIHEGKLVEEYKAGDIKENWPRKLRVRVANGEGAVQVLLAEGYQATHLDNVLSIQGEKAISSPELIAEKLVKSGHAISELVMVQEGLEEHFLQLTGGRS